MTACASNHDEECERRKRLRAELNALPNPSQDTRTSADAHPDDIRLRAAGFRIATRPAKGSAIWERGGREYLQRDALLMVKPVEEDSP